MTVHEGPRVGAAGFLAFLSVLLLHLVVPADRALAQGRDADFEPDPLRPPDVSSPRDTLNSFLTDAHRAEDEFLSGNFDDDTHRAYMRAAKTLDFSHTPDSTSWSVRDRTIVYLLEILDRSDLPPRTKSRVTRRSLTAP